MDEQGHLADRLESHLRKGNRHLRRARLAAISMIVLIVGHLEYLILSDSSRMNGGVIGLLVFYPLLLASFAISGVADWGRGITRSR